MNNNNNKKKKKDEKKKRERGRRDPVKNRVEKYDYDIICNLPKCNEEIVDCTRCLEQDGKRRPAHRHIWINPTTVRVKEDKVVIDEQMIHGHFCLRKGTKVPVLDEARNCKCKTKSREVSLKKFCVQRWVLKPEYRKEKPIWLMDEWKDG
jgi:hypothetical protein